MNKKAGIALLIVAVLILLFYFWKQKQAKQIGNLLAVGNSNDDTWFSGWYMENPLFLNDTSDYNAGSVIDWQY